MIEFKDKKQDDLDDIEELLQGSDEEGEEDSDDQNKNSSHKLEQPVYENNMNE